MLHTQTLRRETERMWSELQPRILPARRGFMALSEPSSGLRIGVAGATEDEVRERFQAEVAAWRELRERRLIGADRGTDEGD
jgi:hypothetical protein